MLYDGVGDQRNAPEAMTSEPNRSVSWKDCLYVCVARFR